MKRVCHGDVKNNWEASTPSRKENCAGMGPLWIKFLCSLMGAKEATEVALKMMSLCLSWREIWQPFPPQAAFCSTGTSLGMLKSDSGNLLWDAKTEAKAISDGSLKLSWKQVQIHTINGDSCNPNTGLGQRERLKLILFTGMCPYRVFHRKVL